MVKHVFLDSVVARWEKLATVEIVLTACNRECTLSHLRTVVTMGYGIMREMICCFLHLTEFGISEECMTDGGLNPGERKLHSSYWPWGPTNLLYNA